MTLPKMYVLGCDQIPWRNADVSARFLAAGLDVEYFAGVHGATVGIAPTLAHFDAPWHHISPGKLSITFSKVLLWQTLVERPEPYALVFENDVTFVPDFKREFEASFAALPADWQVVHVGHCCSADKPTVAVNDRVSEIKHPFCCHAILWTRSAARLALAEFRRHSWGTPSDILLARAVYPKLRHYSFTPPLAFQDETPSEATLTGRWDTIEGWFDYQRLYDEALGKVTSPATFVEVGSWLGRSTAYMAEEIKRRLLPVTFYAVDTWKGTASEPEMAPVIATHAGDLFPAWQRNMSRAGVWDYVRAMRMKSVTAAATFPDASLDFIFLDADHTYEGVKADLAAWTPKLSPRGTIAGHDIDRPDVRRAVDEAFRGRWRQWERTWIVDPR